MTTHIIYMIFLFALGSCVGSFLNVVVWRLPRGESLVNPPSRCPKCGKKLAWYDNLPVIGWIKLAGKCRWCKQPISIRYPIVEAITGLIFIGYYYALFVAQIGPCRSRPMSINLDWPIFGMYLFMLACLLAGSLIDAELFIIPGSITIWMGVIGFLVHTFVDQPGLPGALSASPTVGALACGGTIGLIISIVLRKLDVLPMSFPKGEPLLEVDKEALAEGNQRNLSREEMELPPDMTPGQIRVEILKELLFLSPAIVLAILCLLFANTTWWSDIVRHDWVSGLLGSIFGALIGGAVVWLTRIFGTLGFGRVAMGLGDVDLMCGVGACIGAAGSVFAFFLAPFFGILVAIYMLATGTKRELPYGPYLSLATACVVLIYCPMYQYFLGGIAGLAVMAGR